MRTDRQKQYRCSVLAVIVVVLLAACSHSTELSEDERKAAAEITGETLAAVEAVSDITVEAMTESRKVKFPAVKKVHRTESGRYIFVAEPVAYNGPVTILVVIDSASDDTAGMRILRHEETEHYVRDMESSWFTDRFAGKSVLDYLIPVRLEADRDNEVIMITGATVTTEGIVNGVNACMGVYREYALGQESDSVDLMVERRD